jgi:hypothetical protein
MYKFGKCFKNVIFPQFNYSSRQFNSVFDENVEVNVCDFSSDLSILKLVIDKDLVAQLNDHLQAKEYVISIPSELMMYNTINEVELKLTEFSNSERYMFYTYILEFVLDQIDKGNIAKETLENKKYLILDLFDAHFNDAEVDLFMKSIENINCLKLILSTHKTRTFCICDKITDVFHLDNQKIDSTNWWMFRNFDLARYFMKFVSLRQSIQRC